MTERELDQLLDAALPGYVAEAPDGLAGRVVERARRRWGWPWVAGLAAAAGLAVAMVASGVSSCKTRQSDSAMT